jgi:TDG/mug DNA glycosylase family protein
MIHYQHKNAKLLFVGINPHPGSFNRGVPFSNNKQFWYLLSSAGLIDESRDELREDAQLVKVYKNKFNKIYELGLVNIIERPTINITLLKNGEEQKGRQKIKKIIETQKPEVVCFIGKVTYEKYIGSKNFTFSWQDDIAESKVYVMHSPLRGMANVRIQELKIVRQKCSINSR